MAALHRLHSASDEWSDAQKPWSDHPLRKAAPPRRELDTCLDLLGRAGTAIDALLSRCRELEGELGEVTERAQAEAAAHASSSERWKKLASGMESQINDLKERLGAMEARVGDAEAHAASLLEANDTATRRANDAEDLVTRLHDRIVQAFGIGSRTEEALASVGRGGKA